MKILNLTQHPATPDQIAAGVVDLGPADAAYVRRWLTASDLAELRDGDDDAGIATPAQRADFIADRAADLGAHVAMIGGAPWLMEPLAAALREHRIRPCYAFSARSSSERVLPDGSIEKHSVFIHQGFVS